jgi:hypothetical protein
MRRTQLVVFGLSLVVLLLAGGAAARPSWLEPEDLSAFGGNAESPQVAIDSAGNALAVWYRWNGQNSQESVVQVAEHRGDAGWAAPLKLSPTGWAAYYPQLAVNGDGDAVAVWYGENPTSTGVVQAASRPAGGIWGPADNLSPGHDPHVAIDPYGSAMAVWERFDGATSIIQASFRPHGLTWSAPADLSAPGSYAAQPEVALDHYGNALAIWRRFDGRNWVVQAAAWPSGGGWSAPQDLSAPGQDAQIPQVAIDRYGNALAIWRRFDGANWIVQAAFRPFSLGRAGDWSAPEDLSAPRYDAGAPKVAYDSLFGDAVAIWTRNDDTVQVADRPVGGPWGPPQDLATPGFLTDEAQIALDSEGNAVALWRRSEAGEHGVIQAERRPAGGDWGTAQVLSRVGQAASEPQLAVDPAGNAVATWSRLRNGDYVVQADPFDAAGPEFRKLSIPGHGVAGVRLAFSVTSFDAWSGPAGPPHWRFGDGGDAYGSIVQHTYRRPGSYTVTLSQADAVDNRSSLSRRVSIEPVKCRVPNVIGRTLARARAALARAHCRAGRVTRAFWSEGTKGRVIAQHPRAGKRLPQGARVDLLVSRGARR